jgi:hypothetical protein
MMDLLNNPYFNIALIAVVLLASALFLGVGLSRGAKPNRVTYEVLREYQDLRCRPVLKVRAPSSRDASRAIDGITYPGNVSWEVESLGNHEYLIRVRDFDTKLERRR